MITVDERIARFKAEPVYADAYFLAQYATDARDYLDAVSYYRKCQELSGRNYSYDIFKNTANGIWNDIGKFEDVFPAADAVINAGGNNYSDIISMATSMARLARKMDRTDKIAKYLQAGIDAAQRSRNQRDQKSLVDLRAEYALYAGKDTAAAVDIKRSSLGEGWTGKPDVFYDFSKWCAERKINLQEAEYYTRKALKLAQGDEFQAKVMDTLAEIIFAKGDVAEAISIMEQVIRLNPEEESYFDRLRDYKGKSSR